MADSSTGSFEPFLIFRTYDSAESEVTLVIPCTQDSDLLIERSIPTGKAYHEFYQSELLNFDFHRAWRLDSDTSSLRYDSSAARTILTDQVNRETLTKFSRLRDEDAFYGTTTADDLKTAWQAWSAVGYTIEQMDSDLELLKQDLLF
jgi:hypothetical protein